MARTRKRFVAVYFPSLMTELLPIAFALWPVADNTVYHDQPIKIIIAIDADMSDCSVETTVIGGNTEL